MKKYLTLWGALFLIQVNRAQIINTTAGTGSTGFNGDNISATTADLSTPNDVAVDAAGNVYIADSYNHRIRKVSPSGIITTFAGTGVAGSTGDGGQAINAQINTPLAVDVDKFGNVYICEFYGYKVRKVTPSGIISTFAGTGTSGLSGDGGLAINAQINLPHGVAFDENGNVFIVDPGNNRIRVVGTNSIINTYAGTSAGFSGDGGPANAAQLNNPCSIAFDANGNGYIGDYNNCRVRMVNSNSIISTFAGTGTNGSAGDGGQAINAQLSLPSGIAFDPYGNMYVSMHTGETIRKIDQSGIITTFAGNGSYSFGGDGGPAVNASFSAPSLISVDALNVLYIADRDNNRIRKVYCGVLTPTNTTNPANQNICATKNTTLSAMSSGSVTWYPTPTGTNSIGSGTSFITATLSAGTYTFYAETNSGCATNPPRTAVSVTVNSQPNVIVSSSPTVICSGQQATLSVSGANSYTWNPSIPMNNVVNPSISTTYTVVGTSANSCTNSAIVSVIVTTCNAILQNNLSDLKIKVFPNPFTEFVIVNCQNTKTYSLQIFNALGELILSGSHTKESEIIDLRAYSNGLYYLKINTDAVSSTIKLIKE